MISRTRSPRATTSTSKSKVTTSDVLKWLESRGSARNRAGMARYGIVADKVFGVSVADLRAFAMRIGRDHALAGALWKTGWYEARMLTAFIDEPERVTPAQMDRQAREFDNWAICDTMCFHLYDKTPHAWGRIRVWSRRRDEFVKRAAFASIASLALHDRTEGDAPFLAALPLIVRAASDDRNYVKKGVSWALRSLGARNSALNAAAIRIARELTARDEPSARWIGRDALRDLTSATTKKRLTGRSSPAGTRRSRQPATR